MLILCIYYMFLVGIYKDLKSNQSLMFYGSKYHIQYILRNDSTSAKKSIPVPAMQVFAHAGKNHCRIEQP